MNKLLKEFLSVVLDEANRFRAVSNGETPRIVYFGSAKTKADAISAGTHREYNPSTDINLGVQRGTKIPQKQTKAKDVATGKGGVDGKVSPPKTGGAKEPDTAQPDGAAGITPGVLDKTPSKVPSSVGGKQYDMSGLDTTSEATKASIGSIAGGQDIWAAVTGQKPIRGGMGAGTHESKAAEASKVIICNALLQGKPPNVSMKDYIETPEAKQLIDTMVSDLQNAPGSRLKDSWTSTVRAQAITSLVKTEEVFDSPIESICWDNEEGRKSLGLGKKQSDDRSDSYFKLKDNSIIGTSLKKNGDVFLANLGYAKSMTQMQNFVDPDDKETGKVLFSMRDNHRNLSNDVIGNIIKTVQADKNLQNKIKRINRNTIRGSGSKDFDDFFNKNGSIKVDESGTPLVLIQLNPDKPAPTSARTKLLLKILGSVSPDSIRELRTVDDRATEQLMDSAKNNPRLRKVLSRFMANQLDIPQMLSSQPFEGSPISAITTVYGEGSVTSTGAPTPLFVHGGSLRKMFGISENASDEEAKRYAEDNLYIDSDADSPLGIVRLRIANPKGKPPYFYPIIANIALRARGLGEAATMECAQHSAWTHMLSAGSPDPNKWTHTQRRENAESTLKFLRRQKNLATDDEQKSAIEEEIQVYEEIYKQNS